MGSKIKKSLRDSPRNPLGSFLEGVVSHIVEAHKMRQVDIAVSSPDGQLQLVEIKSKFGASTDWVTRMRHNLLAHSFIPHTPYFLLVLPDFFRSNRMIV